MDVSTGLVQDRARAFGKKIVGRRRGRGADRVRLRVRLGEGLGRRVRGARLRRRDRHGQVRRGPRPREWASHFQVTAIKGDKLDLSVAGISKPDRFDPLGTGRGHDRPVGVRRVVHRRARALRVRGGRRRLAAGAREGARVLPGREAPVEERVPDRPVRLGGPDPRDLLRPPRPGRDRLAVRHREHAGALGARAHARARDAAGRSG